MSTNTKFSNGSSPNSESRTKSRKTRSPKELGKNIQEIKMEIPRTYDVNTRRWTITRHDYFASPKTRSTPPPKSLPKPPVSWIMSSNSFSRSLSEDSTISYDSDGCSDFASDTCSELSFALSSDSSDGCCKDDYDVLGVDVRKVVLDDVGCDKCYPDLCYLCCTSSLTDASNQNFWLNKTVYEY